ncbi:hypothetical protein, unknown function [Leishmania tarentolae]|uniref:Uncharacterized protein n=1 Tax=Leishmania tarentolae TaxID=5689 RepID=A0A640KA61_LEITA|nr:hypothetical protein, unknown function [Leishmania tarentolae]
MSRGSPLHELHPHPSGVCTEAPIRLTLTVSCRHVHCPAMNVFLAVVGRRDSTADNGTTLTDDVALFDPGVWTRTEASEMACRNVSASYVAQQVHRHAALTHLAESTQEGVVCFRYGPRPPPHLDSFLFHKSSRCAAPGKNSSTPAEATPPVGTPRPHISSWLSSVVSTSVVPPPAHRERSTAADSSGSAIAYDSLLALWLRERLSATDTHVAVTALLLFVEGTTIDMVTGSKVHTHLSVGSGTQRQLHTDKDAMEFLHACESTMHDSAAEFPRFPYHVCIRVRDGTPGDPRGRNTVTFLDLAPAAPESAGIYDDVHLREQLALFSLQLGDEAATATSHACSRRRTAAGEQWLGFLESLQLSRAGVVGILYLECEESHDLFHNLHVEESSRDPFSLASALRQRAHSEAAHDGVLYPALQKPSHEEKCATARYVKPPTRNATTVASAPDFSVMRCFSIGQQRQHIQTLPYLTCSTAARRSAGKHRTSLCTAPRRGRSADRLGHLQREEHHARLALSRAEQQARKLAEVRWLLCTRSSCKSIDTVRQSLLHVARVSPPEQARKHSVRSGSSVSSLNEAELATAISRSLTTAARRSSSASPVHTPESPSHDVTVQEKMTGLVRHTSPPRVAPSSFFSTRRTTSSTLFHETGSPLKNQDLQARPTSLHAAVHIYSAADAERNRLRARASLSGATDFPFSRTYNSVRRLSAVETAVLARAQTSSQRSLHSRSMRKGEVERLYPLVHAFHVEMNEQDALMAEELMMRSCIEHKERNCRKKLSVCRAKLVRAPSFFSEPETGMMQQREPQVPFNCQLYAAQPPSLRLFFQ